MKNQKAVLIKDGSGNILEKRVYAGDTSNLENNLINEKVIYELFQDDADPAFLNAQLVPSPPTIEDRVLALETSVSAISVSVGMGVSKNV